MALCFSCIDFEDDVNFLKYSTGPWDEISSRWKKTLNYRRKTILSSNERNIKDILEQWPLYKSGFGPDLVSNQQTLIIILQNTTKSSKFLSLQQETYPKIMALEYWSKNSRKILFQQFLLRFLQQYLIFNFLNKIIKIWKMC